MDTAKNSPDWFNKATGVIDVERLIDGPAGINGPLQELRHALHHLVSDLEAGFALNRATVDGETVTLKFQRDGIDASLWLVGLAWNRAKDLVEIIEAVQRAIDEAAE